MASRRDPRARPLPAGFVDVGTDDGVVYVNPSQVAYVRDEPDMPLVEQTLSDVSGAHAKFRA